MHELGIAQNIVEIAVNAARDAGAVRVTCVRVKIGELAGIAPDALRFSFDVASEHTSVRGAELIVESVPVTVHCHRCSQNRELIDLFRFVCPSCGEPCTDLVSGRELEVDSIEVI